MELEKFSTDYRSSQSMKRNMPLVAAVSQMKIQLADAFNAAGRVDT
jgi:hypothetical protein